MAGQSGWKLESLSPELGGRLFDIQGTMSIGRAQDSDICIALIGMSRRHARITVCEDGLLVEDLDQMCAAAINLNLTLSTDGSCGPSDHLTVPAATPVTYCYTVSNVAPVTVTTHTLVDNVFGPLLTDWSYTLAPGSSVSYSLTVPATQSATHLATWTANGNAAAQATATLTVTHPVYLPLLRK